MADWNEIREEYKLGKHFEKGFAFGQFPELCVSLGNTGETSGAVVIGLC